MLKGSFWSHSKGLYLKYKKPAGYPCHTLSILDYDLDILHLFRIKIKNNLTTLTFYEMSYNFSKVGMENLAKT